ncbi:MAG: chemotaxis protein CheW [Planctomycetota bacterium]
MRETTNDVVADDAEKAAYLIFSLDGSDYAICVDHVREIITSIKTSPVPGSPDYLSGVSNLRGRILPMVDLRERFGMPSTVSTDRDCYVILMLEHRGGLVEVGVRVDAVKEVARIAGDEIDPAPSIHDYANKLVFRGVTKTASGVKLVLDSAGLIQQLREDVRVQYLQACESHLTNAIDRD